MCFKGAKPKAETHVGGICCLPSSHVQPNFLKADFDANDSQRALVSPFNSWNLLVDSTATIATFEGPTRKWSDACFSDHNAREPLQTAPERTYLGRNRPQSFLFLFNACDQGSKCSLKNRLLVSNPAAMGNKNGAHLL